MEKGGLLTWRKYLEIYGGLDRQDREAAGRKGGTFGDAEWYEKERECGGGSEGEGWQVMSSLWHASMERIPMSARTQKETVELPCRRYADRLNANKITESSKHLMNIRQPSRPPHHPTPRPPASTSLVQYLHVRHPSS